ncbi:unnamed protein product, partial [Cuscuta epithymum]
SESKGISYKTHRCIGITLFCLATLQITALFMRPNKDHKYRPHWKWFHTIVGYTTIALSITNVYKGFDALGREDNNWKKAYTGVIIALGIVAVILEAITWPVVIKRKKRENENKPEDTGYEGNGQH